MGNCFGVVQTNNTKKKIMEDEEKIQVNECLASNRYDIYKVNQSQDLKDKELHELHHKKKHKKVVGQQLDEQVVVYEDINKIQRTMTKDDIDFNKKALNQHFIFSQLSETDKDKIMQQMFYCENSKEYIFKYGDQASSYFIIEKGQCQVIINDNVVRELKEGEGFGELALLYGSTRTASIKCVGNCKFWAIDRQTFRNYIESLVSKEFEENRKFIENTKFFSNFINIIFYEEIMTDNQKDAIANVTITQVFQKDQWVVTEGDMATSYYIIKKGQVSIIRGGQELRKMEAGDEFGEQALLQDSRRKATVKACVDDTQLLSIGRDQIQKVLGDKVQAIIWNNQLKWAFSKNSLFCKLSNIQIEKCVNYTKFVKYHKNQVVFHKQMAPQTIVFVLEGDLMYEGSKKLVARKGDILGEEWLIKSNKDKRLDDNIIISTETGLLAELIFSSFFEVIGTNDIQQAIKKNENNHEQKYIKKFDADHAKKYRHLKLDDMILIKKLGAGQFGSVFLVNNKVNQKNYALKVIQKYQIIEQKLEKHLQQEKQVNESIFFPFIMTFKRTYKDENNIYFLNEYIKGMELFDVIREIGILNTYDSQFYIGSMLLCIEYLHTNCIIYRDIKPENIMVDYKGYMKLIDLGTAKFLKGVGGRTHTIIGTPHYMAPEILTGKGYTFNVDYWSIGVCLYEFLCGNMPFAEDKDDPYEIYEEIIRNPVTFPSYLQDKNSKKIIRQLLDKQPQMRLGGSFAALKANKWFETFDWDQLMDNQLTPPYIPPKDKMINDTDFEKILQKQVCVIKEIQKEIGSNPNPKLKSKVQDWDKDF